MESKQPVDLERLFKMFCEKADIKNEEVLVKDLRARGPIVMIDVVVRSEKNCFRIMQSMYYAEINRLGTINKVFLGSSDLERLQKFIESWD